MPRMGRPMRRRPGPPPWRTAGRPPRRARARGRGGVAGPGSTSRTPAAIPRCRPAATRRWCGWAGAAPRRRRRPRRPAARARRYHIPGSRPGEEEAACAARRHLHHNPESARAPAGARGKHVRENGLAGRARCAPQLRATPRTHSVCVAVPPRGGRGGGAGSMDGGAARGVGRRPKRARVDHLPTGRRRPPAACAACATIRSSRRRP